MDGRFLTFEGTRAVEAARALGSEVRAEILEMVGQEAMTVSQIAARLQIAQPAVTNHIRLLEDAGLLSTFSGTGERGVTKLCRRSYDEIRLRYSALPAIDDTETALISLPVGHYSRCEINPTCGMASPSALIGFVDDPRSFYLPDHTEADILWLGWGFVEYEFPNPLLVGQKVDRLEFSFEICSEAPGYAENYPSDVDFTVNGIEVGSWRSPGDMGVKQGLLNPDWWKIHNYTQYGFLKTLSLREDGCYLDGTRISSHSCEELLDTTSNSITLRLEVKENAKYRGGITLFGKNFGNYAQDIVMALVTRK